MPYAPTKKWYFGVFNVPKMKKGRANAFPLIQIAADR